MTSKKFYTYAHFKSSTDEVFYIGKGVGGRCASNRSRSRRWRNVVAKHGFWWAILHEGTAEECLEVEKRLIARIGRLDLGTGPLINHTDGGDGLVNPSPETRRRLSSWQRGRKLPEKERLKRVGKVHSPETRAKMSASHTGKVRSAEHSANLRGSRSDETRRRISEGHAGKKNWSAKPIVVTHPDGTEERFECAKYAIDKYGFHQSEISKCCRGLRRSHRGFHFRFDNAKGEE